LHWKTKEGLVRGCSCRGTAGFAHLSCLAEQVKILVAEAEENNWDDDRFMPRWHRWSTCGLCKQEYHGVVRCALGWASWKTYLGRPEKDVFRIMAMTEIGNGLSAAHRHEDALSVQEAQLSMRRRLGMSEEMLLPTQGNLANTYSLLGQKEEALRLRRDVYFRYVKLHGDENFRTLTVANNYAMSLLDLHRYAEVRSVMRKAIPIARRVVGESSEITLKMRWNYALALYRDPGATLDDLREAVTTLEETERTARRVFGSTHPLTGTAGRTLLAARAALRAREPK
jgi:hypothetical protein